MINVQKKSECVCECKGTPGTGKPKDVIVITIETCCKKKGDKNAKTEAQKEIKPPPADPPPVPSEAGDPSQNNTDNASFKSLTTHSNIEPKKSEIAEPHPHAAGKEVAHVYRLPILLDRYHGPGCAMEINVLERHDKNCLYKKEPTEGRSLEDRVGSYECIGRLTFRTCNPTDSVSDSSGVAAGVNPGNFSKHSAYSAQSAHSKVPQSTPILPGDKTSTSPEFISTEDMIVAEKQEVNEAPYYRNYRSEVMAPKNEKPSNHLNFMQSPKQNAVATQKPFYSDGSNQTETETKIGSTNRISLETIHSYTDLSKKKKKKKGFFSSLFKKNKNK